MLFGAEVHLSALARHEGRVCADDPFRLSPDLSVGPAQVERVSVALRHVPWRTDSSMSRK